METTVDETTGNIEVENIEEINISNQWDSVKEKVSQNWGEDIAEIINNVLNGEKFSKTIKQFPTKTPSKLKTSVINCLFTIVQDVYFPHQPKLNIKMKKNSKETMKLEAEKKLRKIFRETNNLPKRGRIASNEIKEKMDRFCKEHLENAIEKIDAIHNSEQ